MKVNKIILLILIIFLHSCTDNSVYNLLEYYDKNFNIDDLISTKNYYFANFNIEEYKIILTNNKSSRFNTTSNTVLLAKRHLPRANRTIAHETCHLILASLTDNASIQEVNRFYDEGFCNIFAYQTIDEYGTYKKNSIDIAIEQLERNNLSIIKIQNWDLYYDRTGQQNYYAYNVGSTFIFFLLEKYGIEETLNFIKDTTNTKDIIISILEITKAEKVELEKQWINYIYDQVKE